jgi:hypothetical protein
MVSTYHIPQHHAVRHIVAALNLQQKTIVLVGDVKGVSLVRTVNNKKDLAIIQIINFMSSEIISHHSYL